MEKVIKRLFDACTGKQKKKYNACVVSNKGKIRNINEDNFFCDGYFNRDFDKREVIYKAELSERVPFAVGVFDGMGGTQAGEAAAYIAVSLMSQYCQKIQERKETFDGNDLLNHMNQCILSEAKKRAKTMGCTAVILAFEPERIRIYNVGDSRAYSYQDHNLRQISVDHTVENSIRRIQNGIKGNEKGEWIKGTKHVLTQHLGIPEEEFIIEPAVSPVLEVKSGDIFLLSSDGLTDKVSEQKIASILDKSLKLNEKAGQLVQAAMDAGGEDNITVLLVEM